MNLGLSGIFHDLPSAQDCRYVPSDSTNLMYESDRELTVPPPLLRPDQIAAILYPQCKQKTEFYNECARYAYRSKGENGGHGCDGRPSRCGNGASR